MNYDSDGNLAPGSAAPPLAGSNPTPTPDPTPTLGEFGRFSSVTEAIAYAEGAGNQGPMTLGSDGSITNQFGQVMGYDSDGNLAPTGKVVETSTNSEFGEFGRFSSVT